MKYLLLIFKTIGIQVFLGFVLGTTILIVSWFRGKNDFIELTSILFVSAGLFLFLGIFLLGPKGLSLTPIWLVRGFQPRKIEIINGTEEPSNDEALVGLSEEEQKKYLSIEGYITMIKKTGIGITMFFYSLIFYSFVGR